MTGKQELHREAGVARPAVEVQLVQQEQQRDRGHEAPIREAMNQVLGEQRKTQPSDGAVGGRFAVR